MTNVDPLREELLRARLAGTARSPRSDLPSKTDEQRPPPLSLGQQSMYVLSRRHPDSPEYLIPCALRLRGPLNTQALGAALNALVTRHEILRTRYGIADGRPVQIIDPPRPVALESSDLDDVDDLAAALRAEAVTPMDIERDPPLRVRLLRVEDGEHVLSVVLHHIASDNASHAILWEELAALYRLAAEGAPIQLPDPAPQYAPYALRQQERIGEKAAEHLAYWRENLAGLSPLDLPTDRPRPARRDWSADAVAVRLPAPVTHRLRQIAADADTTLFVVLLTAYQLLLARYGGRQDVTVGSAVSARTRAVEQRIVGYLQNTLVLRARWSGDPTFSQLLVDGRAGVLGAMEHMEVPLHQMADAAGREQSRSDAPLFQTMFDLVTADDPAVPWPGLTAEELPAGEALAKFDLTLQLAEHPDGELVGDLNFATALFERTTAQQLAHHFVTLVRALAQQPHLPTSLIAFPDAAEERALLAAGQGEPAIPLPYGVTTAVLHHAARTPATSAIALPGGAAALSYGDLAARAGQIARRLLNAGVGAQDVVGLCLGRGEWLLPAMLGTWLAGAAYLPLAPDHPDQRLSHMLTDSSTRLVLTDSTLAPRARRLHEAPTVVLDDEAADLAQLDLVAATEPDPDSLAYVIYTSGSTGVPKGVLVTHRGLANYLSWARTSYAADRAHTTGTGSALFSSVAYDLVVTALFVPLLTGRTLHILPEDLSPGRLGQELARHAPYDFLKLTPGHLELLTQQLTDQERATLAGTLVVGGEKFPADLAAQWPHTRLINEYGPTETTVADATYQVRGGEVGQSLPIGRPAPGTSAHVLDERLQLTPTGVPGELWVGGDQVARGYLGRPAQTADRFRPDPFGPPGSRLYRTGDICRLRPGGSLDFLGRCDDQIKIRGHRVEPAETQVELARHPDVLTCVVALRDGYFTGYVVPRPGRLPAAQELKGHLACSLPAHMVPSLFVTVETIPLTPNGKVDYAALPAPRQKSEEDKPQPAGAPDERIAHAWRSVLSLDEVGAHDSFFDLGGDSLHAVALVGTLRESGVDLEVQDVFEHPTIAGLAALASQRPEAAADQTVRPFALLDPADAARLAPGIQDAYPLSLVQAGMVYEMLAGEGDHHYHNTTTYEIRDGRAFCLEAMRAAAATVVARHEALRTSIDLDGYSEPLQLVHDQAVLDVAVTDLRDVAPEEQERRIQEFMAHERATLFDLGRPSLLRMCAHLRADVEWSLTITECHPVLEGWSYNQLFMELLECYDAEVAGKSAHLQDLPAMRYADFIAAEKAALTSATDHAYWRDVVTGRPKFTLPAAWGTTRHGDAAQTKLHVPFDDLLEDLEAAARAAEVPLKSILHMAHLKVMHTLADQDAFHTGLVCDARPELAGAERVLGMFLNTVPFSFTLRAPTWRDLARDVFTTERGMWPHRRFPVPALQREFSPGQRLIDVMFNFLDFRQVDTDLVDVFSTVDDSPNEFPLSVTVFRLGLIDLTAHTGAVSPERLDYLARMYRLVLEAIAGDLDGDAHAVHLPQSQTPTAPPAVGQSTAAAARPLTEVIAEHARARPEQIAVSGARHAVTYRELEREANRLAHHLRARGVGPGSIVALSLGAGPGLVTSLLAVLKTGAAYLPLDPAHPAARRSYCLTDSGAHVLITDGTCVHDTERPPPREVDLTRDRTAIGACADSPPPVTLDPDALAYVIYTSGSTGRPKGVMITHRGLSAYLGWAHAQYGPPAASGAPLLGSVAFDLTVTNLLLPLYHGRDVALLDCGQEIESLAEQLRAGTDFTLLKATPAHLDMLHGALEAAGDTHAIVPHELTVVIGGEPLHAATVDAWRQVAPAARFINEYGPTETVVGVTTYQARPGDTGALAIGRAAPYAAVRILDDQQRPVPPGVAAEICVGGPSVARGYLGRPGATAARFVPDPHGPAGGRLYRTGDLGAQRTDGQLEFLGRIDDQIKIRGYRIEPGEIEGHLTAHPDVRAAAVLAHDDGRGRKRLVAYTVGDADPATLTTYLRTQLPDYMVPATFVPLAALPTTPGGKIDRAALPTPGQSHADRPAHGHPPTTATEKTLAATWSDILRVTPIGADDDFFALGGDSLQVMYAVVAARRAELPLTPRMITRHRTLTAVATALDAQHQHPDTPLVAPPQQSGPLPTWPIREALVREGADLTGYTQSLTLDIDPAPAPPLLQQALHDVVAQHPTLRLRLEGDQTRIAPDETGTLLDVLDLSVARRPDLDLLLNGISGRTRPDAASGPALGAVLSLHGPASPAQLTLAAHRLSVDGVSWNVLVEDLATAYEQREQHRPLHLPAPTTPFATWAKRLGEYAHSARATEQLPYWCARGPHLPLAHDLAGGANTPDSVRQISLTLPMEQPPPRLRDALLAALLMATTHFTGGEGLLVELEGHGRNDLFADLDLTRTVGWFTALHPLQLTRPAAGTDLIEHTTATLRAVPDGGIGYGALRYLGPPSASRQLDALPHPQIRFNYTGRMSGGPAAGRFTPTPAPRTPARPVGGTRSCELEIDASLDAGALTVLWAYSDRLHRESTVRDLAGHHLKELHHLLERTQP